MVVVVVVMVLVDGTVAGRGRQIDIVVVIVDIAVTIISVVAVAVRYQRRIWITHVTAAADADVRRRCDRPDPDDVGGVHVAAPLHHLQLLRLVLRVLLELLLVHLMLLVLLVQLLEVGLMVRVMGVRPSWRQHGTLGMLEELLRARRRLLVVMIHVQGRGRICVPVRLAAVDRRGRGRLLVDLLYVNLLMRRLLLHQRLRRQALRRERVRR